MICRTSLIILLYLLVFVPSAGQEPEQVEWEASDARYNEDIGQGAYRLIDNVVFTHKGVLMYCDSAYYYAKTNSLDAYHNIHVNQGDTVHVYGDMMHYDGNTRIAQINGNVVMEGQNTVLRSSSVRFDLNRNIGYYMDYADIESGDNNLSSQMGYYYADDEMYFFKDSVVLVNPEYTIHSDSLQYHVPTSVSYFLGPTEILSDSGYIYCEDGWYNTETNTSMLKGNALVRNESQVIEADSMYYERETGYGEAYFNIQLVDTVQDFILKGNHAFVNQKEDRALITDKALFIYITDDDSIYVHADTLRAITDTAGFRQLKAYYQVRLFKSNLQGKCDSLFYSTNDSILRLYDQPVLWSGVNQLTAEYIEVRTKNKQIDQLYMDQVAFIINQEDSSRFNQIKGRTMTCYFRDNDLYKIETNGNGQTVYYAKDNNELIGVNIAQSSDLIIFFNENEVDEIRFLVNPTCVLYPLEQAPQEELILPDFSWHELIRPKDRNDIFY